MADYLKIALKPEAHLTQPIEAIFPLENADAANKVIDQIEDMVKGYVLAKPGYETRHIVFTTLHGKAIVGLQNLLYAAVEVSS